MLDQNTQKGARDRITLFHDEYKGIYSEILFNVEKKDHEEWYQVSLGGAEGNDSAIGKIIGPSLTFNQVPEVINRLLEVYLRERFEAESFINTVRRIGHAPFKEHVYATGFEEEQKDVDDKQVVIPAQYAVPYYSPRF